MPAWFKIRLRNWQWLSISLAFVLYGFLPYHKAYFKDTSAPNQLIISWQECGCPCPDAAIKKGRLLIPPGIAARYEHILSSEINLEIKGFNEPYNYELGHSLLYITGHVVGADIVECTPDGCDYAARFKVDHWGLVEPVATAWSMPRWMFIAFLVNLLFISPVLILRQLYLLIRILRSRPAKSKS
jgi:hypothetical protein